jgi:hypothetical protein
VATSRDDRGVFGEFTHSVLKLPERDVNEALHRAQLLQFFRVPNVEEDEFFFGVGELLEFVR